MENAFLVNRVPICPGKYGKLQITNKFSMHGKLMEFSNKTKTLNKNSGK
jgi:hypothetical protein